MPAVLSASRCAVGEGLIESTERSGNKKEE